MLTQFGSWLGLSGSGPPPLELRILKLKFSRSDTNPDPTRVKLGPRWAAKLWTKHSARCSLSWAPAPQAEVKAESEAIRFPQVQGAPRAAVAAALMPRQYVRLRSSARVESPTLKARVALADQILYGCDGAAGLARCSVYANFRSALLSSVCFRIIDILLTEPDFRAL